MGCTNTLQDILDEKYAKEFEAWNGRRKEDDEFHLRYHEFQEYWEEAMHELGCKIEEHRPAKTKRICLKNPDEERPDSFLLVPKAFALKAIALGFIPKRS
jgi:hypothetical protein